MAQYLLVMRNRLAVERCHVESASNVGEVVALRQFPQSTEEPLRFATRQHELVTGCEPKRRASEHRKLLHTLSLGDDGQLILPTSTRRLTKRVHWTDFAAQRRGDGRADRSTELHQALIQVARRISIVESPNELGRVGPQHALARGGFDVDGNRLHPSEHACDIAVDERRALAECDRGDGTGGVPANSRDVP